MAPGQLLPEKLVMAAQTEPIRHIQNYPPEIKVFVGGQGRLCGGVRSRAQMHTAHFPLGQFGKHRVKGDHAKPSGRVPWRLHTE